MNAQPIPYMHTNVDVRLAALESLRVVPDCASVSVGTLKTQSLLYWVAPARPQGGAARPPEDLSEGRHISTSRTRERKKEMWMD